MEWEFSGEVWSWRGPAPWFFVTVPATMCAVLQDTAAGLSYGWGMIAVRVRIGGSEWQTSLWPKDGRYVVPLKASVRAAERVEEGDTVVVLLSASV